MEFHLLSEHTRKIIKTRIYYIYFDKARNKQQNKAKYVVNKRIYPCVLNTCVLNTCVLNTPFKGTTTQKKRQNSHRYPRELTHSSKVIPTRIEMLVCQHSMVSITILNEKFSVKKWFLSEATSRPDWKDNSGQTYSCPGDCCLMKIMWALLKSLGPSQNYRIEGFKRGLPIGLPWCRQSLAFPVRQWSI